MYWYRKHVEDWQAPDEAWTPWQLMGSAVHAGLAMYWKERLRKQAFGVPSNAVIDMFTHGWPQNAPPEFSHDGLESLALKVLDAVLKWIAKNMPDAEPVMVEHPLGPDGHTTPDLVTREAGQLVVTDWKTSWNLDADRMRYRLEGIERDHQFLHYSWAVSEHLREPVTLFRKVVIVGSPRIIVRDAVFRPDPRAIEYWLRSARQMWESMDRMRRGDEVAWLNPNGCFQYGVKYPCPYLDACWTCHGDAEQMKNFLVRTPGGAG
jgi:hypothetical protein